MYLENATTAGRIAANRMLEALGAAGCAAFFVLSCVAGLEYRQELLRERANPEVEISLPSLSALQGARWQSEVSSPVQADPAVAAVAVARAPEAARRPPATAHSPTRRKSPPALVQEADASLLARVARAWAWDLSASVVSLERSMLAPMETKKPRVSTLVRVSTQPDRKLGRIEKPRALPPQAEPAPLEASPILREPPPPILAEAAPQKVAPLREEQPIRDEVPVQKASAATQLHTEPVERALSRVATIEGTVPADGWMSLSFKGGLGSVPRVITFVSSNGSTQEAPLNSQGWVRVPPAQGVGADYSFRAAGVRPGAGIVRVQSPDRSKEAVVAVMAKPGRTALLSLGSEAFLAEPVRVHGHVFEAEGLEPTPVAGVEVQLVGDASRVAITDAHGAYDLGELVLAKEAKVFIEATRAGGFKHRFEATAADQSLFLFSEERLASWGRAFEGGLSPTSGWVVAAVARAGLKPVVEPSSRALTPEVYELSTDNSISLDSEAERRGRRDSHSGRWLGVEIPEGHAQISLQDERGKTLSSTWSVISPGVVNVILLGDDPQGSAPMPEDQPSSQ